MIRIMIRGGHTQGQAAKAKPNSSSMWQHSAVEAWSSENLGIFLFVIVLVLVKVVHDDLILGRAAFSDVAINISCLPSIQIRPNEKC